MQDDCIFCKITQGKIPSQKIFEDEMVIGFKDLRPQAVKHYLFIHKRHSKDVRDLMKNDPSQIKDLYAAITTFADQDGLESNGYRVVTNLGPFAGQTVFHTHFHLLAGEPLGGFGV